MVSIISIVIYFSISFFMVWESWKTVRLQKKKGAEARKDATAKDESSFDGLTENGSIAFRFGRWFRSPPPASKSISLWVIVIVSFIGGLFSGFLGGGAGYIRMPMMVYILGIPTHLAVGTDLFEIIISASYGTFSHAIKGNVDILVALVMNTGAAIGAQIGAILTQYFAGPKIRLFFVPLPLIGVGHRPLHSVYRAQTLIVRCASLFAVTARTPRIIRRGLAD